MSSAISNSKTRRSRTGCRCRTPSGLTRGLHVQSMMYENNYEIALHGQCRFPDRLRAVVAPWPGITDGELDILTKAGVVGYRFAAPASTKRSTNAWWRAPTSTAGRCITSSSRTSRTTGSRKSWQIARHFVSSIWAASIRPRASTARIQVRAAMPRHRPLLGEAVAAHLESGDVPVLRHRPARA